MNPQRKTISEYGFFFGETSKNVSYKMPKHINSKEPKLTYQMDFMKKSILRKKSQVFMAYINRKLVEQLLEFVIN